MIRNDFKFILRAKWRSRHAFLFITNLQSHQERFRERNLMHFFHIYQKLCCPLHFLLFICAQTEFQISSTFFSSRCIGGHLHTREICGGKKWSPLGQRFLTDGLVQNDYYIELFCGNQDKTSLKEALSCGSSKVFASKKRVVGWVWVENRCESSSGSRFSTERVV